MSVYKEKTTAQFSHANIFDLCHYCELFAIQSIRQTQRKKLLRTIRLAHKLRDNLRGGWGKFWQTCFALCRSTYTEIQRREGKIWSVEWKEREREKSRVEKGCASRDGIYARALLNGGPKLRIALVWRVQM